MTPIQEVLIKLAKVEPLRKIVDQFARDKYNNHFENINSQKYEYHIYDGFEIVSNNQIKVKYKFGGGFIDYDGFFIIEV